MGKLYRNCYKSLGLLFRASRGQRPHFVPNFLDNNKKNLLKP